MKQMEMLKIKGLIEKITKDNNHINSLSKFKGNLYHLHMNNHNKINIIQLDKIKDNNHINKVMFKENLSLLIKMKL